jgi:hypothetical protein
MVTSYFWAAIRWITSLNRAETVVTMRAAIIPLWSSASQAKHRAMV